MTEKNKNDNSQKRFTIYDLKNNSVILVTENMNDLLEFLSRQQNPEQFLITKEDNVQYKINLIID